MNIYLAKKYKKYVYTNSKNVYNKYSINNKKLLFLYKLLTGG